MEKRADWVLSCEGRIKSLLPAGDTLIVDCEGKLYFLDRKTGDVGQEHKLEKPLRGLALDRDELFLFLPGEVLCLPPYFLPRWKVSLHYDHFLWDEERIFLWE